MFNWIYFDKRTYSNIIIIIIVITNTYRKYWWIYLLIARISCMFLFTAKKIYFEYEQLKPISLKFLDLTIQIHFRIS